MKGELADWKTFLEEGVKYHRTAQGSVRRPEVFTPEIIQNLAAMSIEKYFMALFMHRGLLPRNHTMTDLLHEGKTLFGIDQTTEDTLLYMDALQSICSMEDFKITKPEMTDVPRFLEALERVSEIARRELPMAPTTSPQ